MKKYLFLTVFIISINASMAQQPGGGTYTAEAQTGLIFSGFGTYTQNQLKVRNYLDSNWAVFIGPEFSVNTSHRTIYENPNGIGAKGSLNYTYKNVLLNIGLLRFFRTNANLAPYVGLQYGYGNQIYQSSTEDCNINGAYQLGFDVETTNAARQQQLVAITGMDYWFKSGFFLGFQLDLTGQQVRTKSAKTVTNDNGFITVQKLQPSTSYIFNSASNSGIKIGWRFN